MDRQQVHMANEFDAFDGAEGEATALAGKRSIRFKAVLRKLVAVED